VRARTSILLSILSLLATLAGAEEFARIGGTGEVWPAGPDARGAGLAEAGVVVADGPFGLWYNPAAGVPSGTVAVGYGSPPYASPFDGFGLARHDWGLQAGLGAWSLGAVRSQETMEFEQRTAWDPDSVEMTRTERTVLLVGGGIDLARPLGLAAAGWTLRVGAGWRHETWLQDVEDDRRLDTGADALDLGCDVRRSYQLAPDARVGWRIGAAWTNVLQTEYDNGFLLSTDYRLAAAVDGAVGRVDGWGEIVQLMVTYERQEHAQPGEVDGGDRVAGELGLFERLRLRLGWTNVPRSQVDGAVWGLGLDLVPPHAFPVTARVDMARGTQLSGLGSEFEETLTRWSVMLRGHF
jgi:hypothetical protein